ncbi:hypothetical protein ACQPYK_22745 [Streptosporangium sp. CA-135522]|uniref:hypothetical protein n=1 Tax=Streptosporangium sp. CA-135522 TaxID=3240072 RepID=UPI003D94D4B3
MTAQVNAVWRQIERWLARKAPVSYRTLHWPAAPGRIAKAEAAMDLAFLPRPAQGDRDLPGDRQAGARLATHREEGQAGLEGGTIARRQPSSPAADAGGTRRDVRHEITCWSNDQRVAVASAFALR